MPKRLADNLHPIRKKVEEHGEQRADVQHDVEIQALGVPAEKPGGEIQVRSTGNGQKLGEALDNGQQNHLVDGHKQPGYGIGENLSKCGCAERAGADIMTAIEVML